MKTILSFAAVAALATLTACGPGTPASKPAQKNDAPPAAGTIKSPQQELKDRMSSTSGSAAAQADQGTKKQ